MKIIDTAIADVKIIEPAVFGDDRGFFFESFNQQHFDQAIGRKVEFVQDNHSRSSKGVLRGLHYQMPPFAQGKLVRCTLGEVYDIAVDIRRSSPTFGQWVGVMLSADNKRQLWIPEGFAHGFLTLSEHAEVQYKANAYWNVNAERSILWNDPQLDIAWPLNNIEPILSAKDMVGERFAKAELSN
ncbi:MULTISPECIES: dTDP-4-dehydrorhamnose 3,5-epimerase [Aquitalea]|uniref:dTDP-4-dehydrorhamnose 3,5-epimerase n=1 Tax=Aquitalea magnusonii TaxID=332411 RepID=A0A318JI43_9NEIS|nr:MULTISPECIES: dTDP-4-dehydrorhamnose 3,5-epimerase [Aquitalea]PXX49493.1 dTDP-4-dehydrorhamnose 3,5-epimerase [Aquitalea magnusonii]